MNQTARPHAASLIRRVFALAFGAVLCWPAIAAAETGQCGELEEMADHGVSSVWWADATEPSSTSAVETAEKQDVSSYGRETPCEDSDEVDDSAEFCFEDADGQISTLPDLLAKSKARQQARELAGSAAEQAAPDRLPVAETKATPPVEEPEEADTCGENPDECSALPPLPPTLVLEGSSAAARDVVRSLDPPVELSPEEKQAWAKLRVGPNEGHRDPPDRPPEVTPTRA
ncbi:MAG: hypothetical protein ACOCV2_04140 [Persicimonas sp.]